LSKISGYLEALKDELSDGDFLELSFQMAHMFHVFDSVVSISKKMYGQSDFYFVYSENTKFTSRQEFTDLFQNNTIFFFSNTNVQYPKIVQTEKLPGSKMEFMQENVGAVMDFVSRHLEEQVAGNLCFFVVSTQKEQSKKLFEEMYQKRIHEKALLLVENIT
jgi:hypothetical protein